jgi:hypothetical protein
MQFASRRFEEIGEMLEQNKKAPDSVSVRWQEHIHDLFEHSRQLSDAQFQQIMEQTRTELTQQLDYINGLLLERPGDASLLKLHSEVSASLRLVENSLKDPQAFRLIIETAEGKEIEHEVENESREHEEQGNAEHNLPVFTPSLTPQNFNITPSETSTPEVSGEDEDSSDSVDENESSEQISPQPEGSEDNGSVQDLGEHEESHDEDHSDPSEKLESD